MTVANLPHTAEIARDGGDAAGCRADHGLGQERDDRVGADTLELRLQFVKFVSELLCKAQNMPMQLGAFCRNAGSDYSGSRKEEKKSTNKPPKTYDDRYPTRRR